MRYATPWIALLFLVEVIWGQQGSNCENLVNNISRRETCTDLIFGMKVYHIDYKNPIVFGGGQRSFGVNSGEVLTPACKHDILRSEAWTDLIFGM